MTAANAVAVILVVGVTMYAVFGGADFGAGFWSLLAGGGERGKRPRALIDWAIGPGVGGEPRVADLRARRLLDRLPVRLRGRLLDAVHPAEPGCVRDRPARSRLRVPAHRAPRTRPSPFHDRVRRVVGADPVLPGNRRRRGCGRPRAGRQCDRRQGEQLGQPALVRDRRPLRGHRRVPGERVPRQRRAPRRHARPRALLHRPRACCRRRHRSARRCRSGRAAPRCTLHLRQPHERRAGARGALARLRARSARPASAWRSARRARRWRRAPSWP